MNSINSTYRFIAFSLAFVMLITSVGFTVDMHYCQGQLKSFSFFGKAKSCHDMTDAAQMISCPHHKKMMKEDESCSLDKKDCCENQIHHIQADQDQAVQTFDFVVNKQLQQFVIAYVVVFCANNLIETDAPSFISYKPPLILRDIYVLIESFLL